MYFMAMESTIQRHSFISAVKQSLWCSVLITLDKRNNLILKMGITSGGITAPTPEFQGEASQQSAAEGSCTALQTHLSLLTHSFSWSKKELK